MKALIISLNFHPGHVSHMIASYKQCTELGYESFYFVDENFENFLPADSKILKNGVDKYPDVDLAIFLFPSQKNLKLIWDLKRKETKILYIFHEPLAPMKEYRKAGFSYSYLLKLWIINRVSSLTVKWSDIVLLPSRKAVEFYEGNKIYTNKNYHYVPLMYDDEKTPFYNSLERSYFSYIGTIAADHSFSEYIDFVIWAISNNKLPNLKFLIATKSTFVVPEILKHTNRVVIKQGKPFSDSEINEYYAMSLVVWNAYNRTTQSGVLAKSFMFGTPALVLRKNLNEFTADNVEVKAISDNKNCEEIADSLQQILKNYDSFTINCRKRFENSFYYRVYNDLIKQLIND